MAFIAPVGAALFGSAAATAGTLSAVSAGIGLASTLKAGNQKAPAIPNAPVTPTPEAAMQKAQAEVDKRRKALLSTGGQTTFTSPLGATVPAGNVQVKTLLG